MSGLGWYVFFFESDDAIMLLVMIRWVQIVSQKSSYNEMKERKGNDWVEGTLTIKSIPMILINWRENFEYDLYH